MAKKKAKNEKPSIPETVRDEEGYETDGMFRWGGPSANLLDDPERLKQWMDRINQEFNMPAVERIEGWRKAMGNLVIAHADGPLSNAEINAIYGRALVFLDVEDGRGCYALHEDVHDNSYVHDALEAVR